MSDRTWTEAVSCQAWGVWTVLLLEVPRSRGVLLTASRRWADGSLRPVVVGLA